MTVTYKTQGVLTQAVNDLDAARQYLREHGDHMEQYIWEDRRDRVHSVTWDLLDASRWEATLVADAKLGPEQLKLLEEWICGQNSDGLGEGFEQRPFAEIPVWDDDEECEAEYLMASFDWETNPCTLTEVSQEEVK